MSLMGVAGERAITQRFAITLPGPAGPCCNDLVLYFSPSVTVFTCSTAATLELVCTSLLHTHSFCTNAAFDLRAFCSYTFSLAVNL